MGDLWSLLVAMFSGFQQVSTVISTVTSIGSSITVVVAGIAYLVRALLVDPFGEKAPKGPRYRKFFESLVARVSKRDKRLNGPDDVGPGAVCAFETDVPGIKYYAHFIGKGPHRGQFAVHMDLSGADSDRAFWGLEGQRGLLEQQFRKHCRDKKQALEWESSDAHLGSSRIAVYYPGSGVIDADAKKLKHIRKWAARRLVAFARVFDQRVPGAAKVVTVAGTASVPEGMPVESVVR